ncbi:MAG TPA: hypothetical protein VNR38_19780 [Ureibacillus sp.]|nr:hypothetical protein [Ureibacillus sp.]
MSNKEHPDHDGTGAKLIVAGGFISSLGEFIQAIGGSLLAIDKMKEHKRMEKRFDHKIQEMEKQIYLLNEEIKKLKK